MRILITRPSADAAALAAKLTAAGHQVISEPMLEIRSLPDVALDLERVQAVLFTSANGVRVFAALEPRRDLPVFAVGDSTAKAARDAGFSQVESAAGDVGDLVRLVRERLQPGAGAVLHAAGRDVAGDLAGGLSAAGFEVRRAVLYAAEPVQAFSLTTAEALRDGQIDLVIFYSARTADTFRQLIEAAGLSTAVRGRSAIGLSRAALEPVANLPWAVVEAASRPDETELLRLIEGQAPPPSAARTAPEATRGQPPKPPPRQSRLGGRLLTPMVWLAVLLSLGTFALQTMQQGRPGSDSGAAGALRLDTRIAALERQIAALSRENRTAADPQVDGRLKQIEGRIAAVESRPPASGGLSPDEVQRIEALESALAKRPDAGDLAAVMAENRRLAADLARVQEQLAAVDAARARGAGREALLLAAGQLALAAAHGDSVAAEIATLRKLAEEEPRLGGVVGELSAIADRPVRTADALIERFPGLATAAVRAARQEEAPAAAAGSPLGAWWNGVVRRLSEAVTIRRVGDVRGEDPDARIARAEQRLAARDLRGAVAALDGIAGPAAGVLAEWLADARARLALDRAVAEVSAAAIAAAGPAR